MTWASPGRGFGMNRGGPRMVYTHEPVLTQAVLGLLSPRPGGQYIDATLGSGGHAQAILEASAPTGRLLGVDRDPDAIEAARDRLSSFGDRVSLVCDRSGRLEEILREQGFGWGEDQERRVDGIIADLGVSSHQLDTPGRGFSFQVEGPLDMRMSKDGQTCADLIDSLDEDGLSTILRRFGEVVRPHRLARAIKERRRQGRLETTLDLAELVREQLHTGTHTHIHPATLVFQALRIAVNRELDELEQLCQTLPDLLAVGGVAAIISFHSLEDRLVKRAFRRWVEGPAIPAGVPLTASQIGSTAFALLNRSAVRPSAEEMERNPRARSARLRAIRRISA